MIKGNAETIKRAQAKKSSDKSSTINWDALDSLPEEYEAVISEIRFNPEKLDLNFSQIGKDGNWMPKPELSYEIATARGISGGTESITEDIYAEVDINRMLAKPIGTPPVMQKRVVGKRVSKYAEVLAEDGTMQRSSVCTIKYNVWERCCEMWAKEEAETNGYSPEIVKTGQYQHYKETKFGPHIIRTYDGKQYANPVKYMSPYARQAHFESEIVMAHAKCETKAHGKAIRELACLPTGYSKEDLKDGVLYFAKIRKSAESIKMDALARRQAIANGHEPAKAVTAALFGPTIEPEPAPRNVTPPPTNVTKRDTFIAVLSAYQAAGKIPESKKDMAASTLKWVTDTPDAESNQEWWAKALSNLRDIESSIFEGKIEHDLLK